MMELSLGEQILILIREKGPLTTEEIAYYLRRDVKEVTEELKYLEHDKLITRVKRGLVFKREAFDLTPTGLEEAQRAYEKLKKISESIINKANTMDYEELEELLSQYMPLIPLMMTLNLIPLELLVIMGLDTLLVETIDDSWTSDTTY